MLEQGSFRAAQVEQYLGREGFEPAIILHLLFGRGGRIYGKLTALLGILLTLHIFLLASERDSRDACGALEKTACPRLLCLVILGAHNEEDVLNALRRNLVDARHRNARSIRATSVMAVPRGKSGSPEDDRQYWCQTPIHQGNHHAPICSRARSRGS